VCNKCVTIIDNNKEQPNDISYIPSNLTRKLTEAIMTIGESSKPILKNVIEPWVKPDYWIGDEICRECNECTDLFSINNPIHHCRQCGYTFCGKCSNKKRPVLSRGWKGDQRVCDICFEKPDET
jgi:hypothetical protein